MKIIVEDAEVELALPDRDVQLKQVVTEVEDFLVGVGKVPIALSIDGNALDQEQLENRGSEVLSGQETLVFGVQTIFEFIRQHLDGAARANEELLKNIGTFASEIHSAEKTIDNNELITEINQFFEFWARLKKLLPQELGACCFDGKGLEEVLTALQGLFEEIVSAMEEQDFVLAADLLQYEVVPSIESVHQYIPEIKEKIVEREQADRREQEKVKND